MNETQQRVTLDSKQVEWFKDFQANIGADSDFPRPWHPDPDSPWVLRASNGRVVAVFTAWNDRMGALIVGEIHCKAVANMTNDSAVTQSMLEQAKTDQQELERLREENQRLQAENWELQQRTLRAGAIAIPPLSMNGVRAGQLIDAPLVNFNDLRIMQQLVVLWADATFPNRTPQSAFMKLFEEIGEVIRSPRDAGEWADLFIMQVDLCKMYGIVDIGKAVADKMTVNAHRSWTISGSGTFQHDQDNAT